MVTSYWRAVTSIRIETQHDFHLPSRKASEAFRNYETAPLSDRTRQHYLTQHTHQCVDFVKRKHAEYLKFDHAEMTVMEAAEYLCDFLDESDPDVDVPNLFHAYQTGESIRARHPDQDWLVLTGFIHDMGKILSTFGEPQWAVTGDTFPIGCEFHDANVYGRDSFSGNPDRFHPVYSSRLGMYESGCGLDQLTMCWGHDEYLYRVLSNHPACTLPEQALYIIRFHSFYPYHKQGVYRRFMNEKDERMGDILPMFSSYDLYSKEQTEPDIKALQPYYQALVDKYVPGKLRW